MNIAVAMCARFPRFTILTGLTTLVVAMGCGGSDTAPAPASGSTGGSSAAGGAGSGGKASTGGSSSTGGRVGTGGSGTVPDAGPVPGSCGGVFCGAGLSCCGPSECGRCVPDTSGVFCPDYCDYCVGAYQRYSSSPMCTGTRTVLWETSSTDPAPFAVADCEDIGTNLPRFCCTPDFSPVCP